MSKSFELVNPLKLFHDYYCKVFDHISNDYDELIIIEIDSMLSKCIEVLSYQNKLNELNFNITDIRSKLMIFNNYKKSFHSLLKYNVINYQEFEDVVWFEPPKSLNIIKYCMILGSYDPSIGSILDMSINYDNYSTYDDLLKFITKNNINLSNPDKLHIMSNKLDTLRVSIN